MPMWQRTTPIWLRCLLSRPPVLRDRGGVPRPASIDHAWAVRTGGNLTGRQKRELLQALLPTVMAYPAMRLRLATGRCGTGRLDFDTFAWPDSALARDAEAHAREVLTPWVLEHSVRTWLIGLVLAQVQGVEVDHELTFVASMLHDLALEERTPQHCFAVVGGERAQAWVEQHGVPRERAAAIGAAICGHLTPGATDDVSDPGGFVSAGALADITGIAMDRADPAWVQEMHRRHPRHDLKRRLIATLAEESRTVPDGRIRTLNRYAGFLTLLRLSPYA